MKPSQTTPNFNLWHAMAWLAQFRYHYPTIIPRLPYLNHSQSRSPNKNLLRLSHSWVNPTFVPDRPDALSSANLDDPKVNVIEQSSSWGHI